MCVLVSLLYVCVPFKLLCFELLILCFVYLKCVCVCVCVCVCSAQCLLCVLCTYPTKVYKLICSYHFVFQAAEAAAAQLTDDEASIISALRSVVWMAKEDIAMEKYPSFIEFQKLQEAPGILNLRTASNATYASVDSGKGFQKAVADTIHMQLVKELTQLDENNKQDWFSILIDESTDIAVNKHLVVYIRFVTKAGEPKTCFFKNVTITNPKSTAAVIYECLKKALKDDGIDITRCIGFGSDGAAVMVGKENGVAALVKSESPHCISIHCLAHRLNLASSQASKDIEYLKEVEKVLADLFKYFGGSKSGNRKCQLEEFQKILDDPQLKIKECHEIRWLAFMEAVNNVLKCWLSLREIFRTYKDKKAVEFYTYFRQYKFLAVLHILMDVLPSVSQFSLLLQAKDLDISSVIPGLVSLETDVKKARRGDTYYQKKFIDSIVVQERDNEGNVKELHYKGKKLEFGKDLKKLSKEIKQIREQFCDTLLNNLKERFPKSSKDIASACGVLAMRKLSFITEDERETYGDTEIATLTDFFGEEVENKKSKAKSKRLIDPVKCRSEWQSAKQFVWTNQYLRHSTLGVYKQLLEHHKDVLPNLLILMKLALILPLHTADCERGFSCQNGILTAKRSCLGEESLNTLMTIKCEGSVDDQSLLENSLATWRREQPRRKFQK